MIGIVKGVLAALLGATAAAQPLEDLIRRAQGLARQDVVMPVEEVRLAAQLAELPDKGATLEALLTRLFDHENFHVRRVGVNAARRIGNFEHPGLMEALVRKVADPHAWVRYDAAWALKDSKSTRPDVIRALEVLSADLRMTPAERKAVGTSDPALRARIMATEALEELRSRPPSTEGRPQ